MLERDFFPKTSGNLLKLLLAQDGSTTKLCEAIASSRVELMVHLQARVETVPEVVMHKLGGTFWLKRVTSLHSASRVLMDNLTFTRLDRVPTWFLANLELGLAPVGHLLEKLLIRRERIESTPDLERELFEVVDFPDSGSSRAYTVNTEEGAVMLVFETYRAGFARAFEGLGV
jgi:chorismate-pyruvate lyase